MEWILNNVWFLLFLLWGLPMSYYRSKFRKIVYQTDNWIINIQPKFGKELKALFTNMYPDNAGYLKMRKFYGFYLIVYLLLFAGYVVFER